MSSIPSYYELQNAREVAWEAQLRIFGFALPKLCSKAAASRIYVKMALDSVVRERVNAILEPRRRARPDIGGNIYGPTYKVIPWQKSELATDPKNIESKDPACTYSVVLNMTEEDRAALRQRVMQS